MFPSSFYRVAAWLVLGLLGWGSVPAAAQQSVARYRYWEADPDSLRRVLAGQRPDTARLRILLHLLDTHTSLTNAERQEARTLATRLGRPEARALHALPSNDFTNPAVFAAQLDSLLAAIHAFDRLGRPVPGLLNRARIGYNALNRQEDRRTYYETRLREYMARGATENVAACYFSLAGSATFRGDYNQSIGYYLRAAELCRRFDRNFYYSHVMVVGAKYAEWGNPDRAMPYLREALHAPSRWGQATFANRAIARLRLAQHDYPAALQAVEQALLPPAKGESTLVFHPDNKPLGLALKGAVLLAQGRTAEAGPLLRTAQYLADSLHLPLTGQGGDFELDAAWARYYGQLDKPARAEAYWLAAYSKARAARKTPLRLAYLRELAGFYQQRGQSAPAARYALAAVALADTLSAAQGALHVAQYEIERAERAQTARIAGLRLAQTQAAARARQQHWLLGAVLVVLALLAGLGFVLWRGNRRKQRANALLSQQKAEIQVQRDQTTQAFTKLQATQAQLIQKEKMASLGELTAGIAHEIQNPLNFVNNFSEVSTELLDELAEEQARPARDGDLEAELVSNVRQNLVKIAEHGRRAAGIVRSMLEHSRTSAGERQPIDLNRLCQEYLRLTYQGLRAKDKSFNAALKPNLAADLPLVDAVATDLGRVLLNLFSNAFYAVRQRQQVGEPGYAPVVGVQTRRVGSGVEIRVIDNGVGVPDDIKDKIFQPFFTTKPPGQGTGLGLSLSHDIITQGHGGTLTVESHAGEGTTFFLVLPRASLL